MDHRGARTAPVSQKITLGLVVLDTGAALVHPTVVLSEDLPKTIVLFFDAN